MLDALWCDRRIWATRRAQGLPGPPLLPTAKRPCLSLPLSPFANGSFILRLHFSV